MLEIEMETITPLFLSGADQGIAELRAPAFRGALRYWLRALLGRTQPLADAANMERDVFGDTTRSSSVGVRVLGHPKTQDWYPSSAQRGMQYLLFSIRQRNKQTRQIDIRPSIPERETFSLLYQQIGKEPSTEIFRRALDALWLLCHLGGLGARSRRGVGSVAVGSIGRQSDLPADLQEAVSHLQVSATTPAELQADLTQQLRRMSPKPREIDSTIAPEFDMLHKACCRIVVVDRKWKRWDEALEAVGQHFKNFRAQQDVDRKQVGNALLNRGAQPGTIERAAFGLPIVFFYRGEGQASLEGKEHDRRASPLHIHITKLADGDFTVVLTCFKSALLPDGEELALPPLNNPRAKPMLIPPPSLAIIDEFLNNLDSGYVRLGEPLEVAL